MSREVNGIRTGAVERSEGVKGKMNNGEYMLISMKKGRKRQYMGVCFFCFFELTKEGADERGGLIYK